MRMRINPDKFALTGALWSRGNSSLPAAAALLDSQLRSLRVGVASQPTKLTTLPLNATYKVLGVELSTNLKFTAHHNDLVTQVRALAASTQ